MARTPGLLGAVGPRGSGAHFDLSPVGMVVFAGASRTGGRDICLRRSDLAENPRAGAGLSLGGPANRTAKSGTAGTVVDGRGTDAEGRRRAAELPGTAGHQRG